MNRAGGVIESVGSVGSGPMPAVAAPHRWTGDFHGLRLRLYLLLLAADCVVLAFAFLFANLARFGQPLESYGVNTLALILPIYLATSFNGGAFSIRALAEPRRSAAIAAQSLLFAIAVAVALLFSLKIGEDFSRLVFGTGSLLALLGIMVARTRIGAAIGRRCDWTFRREVLLADQVPAAAVGTEQLIDAEREGLRPVLDDPVMLQRIGALLAGCERVAVACPPDRRSAWSRVLAGANVDIEMLMPELDHVGATALRRHGQCTSLVVGCGPLGLRQRAIKRAFDLLFSGAALLLLAPLLALIALAIRLETPGPALFRQPRVGRGNRPFAVLKFRTMRVERADLAGSRSTGRADERVSPFGRFLRATSLDELPQLFNVLRGEMSVVGPRPHALGSTAENHLFWSIEERYWDRHAIKPGMTGLAQIRGWRGATERRSDLSNRLAADLEYLTGWTLGRDLAIVIRTLGVMVHRNAY